MGWPKKNEVFRLYFERKAKTYLLVELIPEEERTELFRSGHRGEFLSAAGELMTHNDPERPVLCSCNPSSEYIYKKCKRVQWSDMPEVWQDALRMWIPGKPEDFRGLWKTERKSA